MSTSKVTPLKSDRPAPSDAADKLDAEQDRLKGAMAIVAVVQHALKGQAEASREAWTASEVATRVFLEDSAQALQVAVGIMDHVWSEMPHLNDE